VPNTALRFMKETRPRHFTYDSSVRLVPVAVCQTSVSRRW